MTWLWKYIPSAARMDLADSELSQSLLPRLPLCTQSTTTSLSYEGPFHGSDGFDCFMHWLKISFPATFTNAFWATAGKLLMLVLCCPRFHPAPVGTRLQSSEVLIWAKASKRSNDLRIAKGGCCISQPTLGCVCVCVCVCMILFHWKYTAKDMKSRRRRPY